MYSDRLACALNLASLAHHGQVRKGTTIPYISHPMAVAALALEFGGSEDQAIAAVLHDTVEDGGMAYIPLIEQLFGSEVLAMVLDCTDGTVESKSTAITPQERLTGWRLRKVAYLKNLRSEPTDSKSLLVSACDKLHNVRAILSDFHAEGESVFRRFTAGREGTLWYYDELAAIFVEKDAAPAASLRRLVDELLVKPMAPRNGMPRNA